MKFSRGKKSGGNELFTVPVKMKQEGEFVRLLFRFIEFFFFFSQTRSQSSTATSKTRRVSVMTKVGHYQFSNCGIWSWQHKVTVNVTFHPFKRLRKIPERKFEKRVHQIPVINVASSARETFMKKVLWFWTYSRYRVKKFRYPIIDDI